MTTSSTENKMPVNPEIIGWARARAGFSEGEATRTFRKIALWEAGEDQPTYAQLESMANRFKVPIATFFFPEPPRLPSVEETFRTLVSTDLSFIPRQVKLALRKAKAMQLNLYELNDGRNPAENLLTRELQFSPEEDLEALSSKLREYLGVSLAEQCSWRNDDDALKKWRDILHEKGVNVFKDAFRNDEYSGFCIYDDEFPLIYVNNSTTKTRQIFTIFHELAHLLFHTSGVDGLTEGIIESLPNGHRKIEVICNRFSSEFLLPNRVFEKELEGIEPDRDSAAAIADKYCLSRAVIFTKFLERGLIGRGEYTEALSDWNAQINHESNGNFYNNQFAYLGLKYIDLAFSKYYKNQFDETQLAEYLNVKPRNLQSMEDRYINRIGS